MQRELPDNPDQVLDIIVASEKHRKFVWTAGRVLREAALWTPVETLSFGERKAILKRLTLYLEELAGRGFLRRREELAGPITSVVPARLSHERLPYLEPFRNVPARVILLKALAANGHFFVLIAFESRDPKRTSDFPFLNWFTQSLVPDETSPMWVQRPQGR